MKQQRYYVKNRITSFGVQDRQLGVSITGSKRHTKEEAQAIADFHNARVEKQQQLEEDC